MNLLVEKEKINQATRRNVEVWFIYRVVAMPQTEFVIFFVQTLTKDHLFFPTKTDFRSTKHSPFFMCFLFLSFAQKNFICFVLCLVTPKHDKLTWAFVLIGCQHGSSWWMSWKGI